MIVFKLVSHDYVIDNLLLSDDVNCFYCITLASSVSHARHSVPMVQYLPRYSDTGTFNCSEYRDV